ncbi:ribonuclease R [Ruminococcaceae bacterium OttesenSCG-928-N02]|nr:ribonuclease R [Ruminococcaceae bacterium OttesenSCG-928-N02]
MKLKRKIERALRRQGKTYSQLTQELPGENNLGITLDEMVKLGIISKRGRIYRSEVPEKQKKAAAPEQNAGPQHGERQMQTAHTEKQAVGRPGQTHQAESAPAQKALAKRNKKPAPAPQKTKNKNGEKPVPPTHEKVKKANVKPNRGFAKGLTQTGARGKNVTGLVVNLAQNFAFVRTEEGADVFVARRATAGALPGDEVQLRIESPAGSERPSGRILNVHAPAKVLVGTYEHLPNGNPAFLPANSNGVLVPLRAGSPAKVERGYKIAARFLKRGKTQGEHLAAIETVFGPGTTAAAASKAALYAAGVPTSFPPAVLAQAKEIDNAGISKEEIAARRDLRGELIFTIDAASTKDIDDAISLKKVATGYELGVHIADVSHYVQAGSALDEEAFLRGTSVYYADHVVPMLPKALSNGICSLNPGVERLAFSCFVHLDAQGRYIGATFEKTVIQSHVQGVYDELNALLSGDETHAKKYEEILPMLKDMAALYEKLAALRRARGSADISTSEAYITVDEEGRAIDVRRRESGLTQNIIEEFMLQANNAAARFAQEKGLPFIYRVHGTPEAQRVQTLQKTVRLLGLRADFEGESPTNLELAALLNETAGTPLERAVHMAVLRTMQKAVYSATHGGHYGLALKDYAQFTSPIRRYPDLAIHRILSAFLQGGSAKKVKARYEKFANAAAVQSTAREIATLTAERTCESCYKAEYMQAFIGETFTAVVSSVVGHGIYVELPNTIDGLVPEKELAAAGYLYTEGLGYLGGGKADLRIGSEVRVKLMAVDVARGRIDFALAN